jgi:2-polyprenyl-3-methyl-5-hydroxy-6-metoxy-1,4-benzoquinol methylase
LTRRIPESPSSGALTAQQAQSYSYFNRVAQEWRQKAEGLPKTANIIRQRNECVLIVARQRQAKTALDVGCGTGELVCDLGRLGYHAVGVDFAPEMIALAREKAANEKVDAEFTVASVFDYRAAPASVDLIAANGFIEYITPEQLKQFLALAGTWLAPGGVLVVGSRNRLFNAFSLNAYTRMELEAGTIPALIEEAAALASAPDAASALHMLRQKREPLPFMARHPETGIEVATRHQYTPGELARLGIAAGLEPSGLWAINYHAVGVHLDDRPEIHASLAEMLFTEAAARPALVPFASSFVLALARP